MVKRQTKPMNKLPVPQLVVDNTDPMLRNILAAAANPRVSAEKFRQLMDMKHEEEDRVAKIGFDNALAQLQPLLPEVDKKGRIVIRKKDPKTGERTGPIEQVTGYGKWEDINRAIKPLLHQFGFSLSFRTPIDPQGRIAVTAVLARGGHREETTLSYQHDSTGSKNAAQAINSSVSYGQRKTACALLNITCRGEDDDAVRSAMLEVLNAEQLADLHKLADEANADIVRFCALLKVESMEKIPALRYEEARAQLQRKIRQKAAKADKSDFPGDRPMKEEPQPQ